MRRVTAFQAVGRGSDSRLPLQFLRGQKDQTLYGNVIACVVGDEGNIQVYCRGCDPGIRK